MTVGSGTEEGSQNDQRAQSWLKCLRQFKIWGLFILFIIIITQIHNIMHGVEKR